MTSLEQFLKTVRIFENLTQEELAHLVPLFEIRNAKNKEIIIREGETSGLFYVIRTGHCMVTKGAKNTFLTVLGPKEYFGEASLFHDVRRSATVTVSEDCQLLLMDRDPFQQYLLSYPIAANRILFQMLKDIFFRLDETTQELLLSGGPPTETALHRLLR